MRVQNEIISAKHCVYFRWATKNAGGAGLDVVPGPYPWECNDDAIYGPRILIIPSWATHVTVWANEKDKWKQSEDDKPVNADGQTWDKTKTNSLYQNAKYFSQNIDRNNHNVGALIGFFSSLNYASGNIGDGPFTIGLSMVNKEIPAGATRFVLGCHDGRDWLDNEGTIRIIVQWTGDIESSSYTSESSESFGTSSSESSFLGTSSSTSSSSPGDVNSRDTRGVVINENNNNIIPWTIIGEEGKSVTLGDDSIFNFQIEGSSSTLFDHVAFFGGDNDFLTEIPAETEEIPSTIKPAKVSAYIPNNDDAEFEHRSQIYFDVITQDLSGVSEVRTHVEPEAYDFHVVDKSYVSPKFVWTNNFALDSNVASGNVSSNVSSEVVGSVWIGTDQETINKVNYESTSSTLDVSLDVSGEPSGFVFEENKNTMFVSTDSYLYSCTYDKYLRSSEIVENFDETNGNRGIVSRHDSNGLWIVEPSTGYVKVLDVDTFTLVTRYSGFDGPFKVLKTDYYDEYFVVGEHALWKLNIDTGVSEVVYEINDYRIIDCAMAPSGQTCLLLGNSGFDQIRILDSNLYSFILDYRFESLDEDAKLCSYVDNNRFYILSELTSGTYTSFQSKHYVFDFAQKVLSKTSSVDSSLITTTTTTSSEASQTIKIQSPNGGEALKVGQNHDIKWISNKSYTDLVSIDLYKGGVKYETITEQTQNSGVYSWSIPTDFVQGEDYKIRITWISPSTNDSNHDESDNSFFIVSELAETTTSTTTVIPESPIGVGYDSGNDVVVIVLSSGLFMTFSLQTLKINGFIDPELGRATAMGVIDDRIEEFDTQGKVRVWVGSEPFYSDKWDSGVVETELTAMYYGGGNNLKPGHSYYLQIQTYSEKTGWGDVQTQVFTMPKA